MHVISINIRGLNNKTKRQTLFHWLDINNFDIVLLQETFCTKENQETFTKDWKGNSFHCLSSSTHSKGVSILIQNKFDHKCLSCFSDENGRKILINIDHNGHTYSICSIYAPTEVTQRKLFFHSSQKWIEEKALNTNCLTIGGDFNCSLTNKDRKTPNVDRSRDAFKKFISNLKLKDTYSQLNADKLGYTYSNANGSVQSRIDYILCSEYMKPNT